MGRVVIADTTCLIAFDHIGKLQILKSLFGSLVVTDFVSLEYGRPLPGFIQIQNPVNKNVIRQHINS
jgi:predicted nucleic acid-binding protein